MNNAMMAVLIKGAIATLTQNKVYPGDIARAKRLIADALELIPQTAGSDLAAQTKPEWTGRQQKKNLP